MTLREQVAMAICQAPEYAVRHDSDVARLVPMRTRCSCAHNGHTPDQELVRCANSLAKADAAIASLHFVSGGLGVWMGATNQ